MAPDHTAALVAAIRNAAWLVRHASRPAMRERRARALRDLGLAVRRAFNETEDFEPLLGAVLDGLAPREERRF